MMWQTQQLHVFVILLLNYYYIILLLLFASVIVIVCKLVNYKNIFILNTCVYVHEGSYHGTYGWLIISEQLCVKIYIYTLLIRHLFNLIYHHV